MVTKKKSDDSAVQNLHALDKLITYRASEQAIHEWEDFLDIIKDWLDSHETAWGRTTAWSSCAIYGERGDKTLRVCNNRESTYRDAVIAMCSGINGLAHHFVQARAETMALDMASDLLAKANQLKLP